MSTIQTKNQTVVTPLAQRIIIEDTAEI